MKAQTKKAINERIALLKKLAVDNAKSADIHRENDRNFAWGFDFGLKTAYELEIGFLRSLIAFQ